MAELILYDKVVNINKLFQSNNPYKYNIKTLKHKYSTIMQYSYISIIEIFSNNFPTCDNRTTVRTVLLNCGMWLQG